MIWIDYALLGIVALSLVIGLVRGFLREIVSLLTWIAAFWVSLRFHPLVAERLAQLVATPWLRAVLAYSLLFLAVLLLGLVLKLLLGMVMKASSIKAPDRFAGALFGLARGGVIVAMLMTLGAMTPLKESPWWKQSILIGYCAPLVERVRTMAPPGMHPSKVVQALRGFSR